MAEAKAAEAKAAEAKAAEAKAAEAKAAEKEEGFTVWVKPSKKEVKLNDDPATVKEATRLGWKPKSSK